MPHFVTLGLSSTVQQTVSFASLSIGAVNRSLSYRLDASGKAVNAARVLNQLERGCVSAVCPLGRENASLFLSLAADDCLPVIPVMVPGKTRFCYTLLDRGPACGSAPAHGEGRATELVVSEPVSTDETSIAAFSAAGERIREMVSEIPGGNCLLLAGSRPASFPGDIYPEACRLARAAGVPVMTDFHGPDLLAALALAPPDIIKINEEEFLATFAPGISSPGERDLAGMIASESARLGNVIVITRGPDAVLAADRGKAFRRDVEPLKPVNVIGCGDSFAAGFLHAWAEGLGMDAALERAVRCAAANAVSIRPGSILPDESTSA